MNGILKGIRPLDYVLAGLMTAAGAFLMYENITGVEPDGLPHPLSTTSWVMLPVFVLVTLPILWRRRNILAVIAVTAAATAVHVLAFGWITRCGVELPLAFALAYAVARFAGVRRNQVIGLAGIVVAAGRDARQGCLDRHDRAAACRWRFRAPPSSTASGSSCRIGSPEQSAAVAPVTERAAA